MGKRKKIRKKKPIISRKLPTRRNSSGKRELSHQAKTVIFLFPIACSLFFLILKIVSQLSYQLMIQEDSAIENIQVFAYSLSSLISLAISIRFFSNRFLLHAILYAILFIGLLFISMDEISWGQRIFDIESSEYFETHNMQNEISLHNLYTVQPYLHNLYILVGFYGTFAWLLLRRITLRNNHIVNFVVPDWFISSYFFFVFLIYTYFDYFSPIGIDVARPDVLFMVGFIGWRDQEPAEFFLSLGFLIFTIVNNNKSKKMCQTVMSTSTV